MAEAKANDDVEADGPSGTPARAQSLMVAHRNELTPAEIQEINKRLRLRAFLLCVYASIWGMGGHLVGEASRVMCSGFIRQVGEVPLLNLGVPKEDFGRSFHAFSPSVAVLKTLPVCNMALFDERW